MTLTENALRTMALLRPIVAEFDTHEQFCLRMPGYPVRHGEPFWFDESAGNDPDDVWCWHVAWYAVERTDGAITGEWGKVIDCHLDIMLDDATFTERARTAVRLVTLAATTYTDMLVEEGRRPSQWR